MQNDQPLLSDYDKECLATLGQVGSCLGGVPVDSVSGAALCFASLSRLQWHANCLLV